MNKLLIGIIVLFSNFALAESYIGVDLKCNVRTNTTNPDLAFSVPVNRNINTPRAWQDRKKVQFAGYELSATWNGSKRGGRALVEIEVNEIVFELMNLEISRPTKMSDHHLSHLNKVVIAEDILFQCWFEPKLFDN